MKSKILRKQRLLLCAIILLVGCSGGANQPVGDNFNRRAMLLNIADSIINPAYSTAHLHAEAMESSVESFCAAPGEQTLAVAQVAWKSAYLAWQDALTFNFGPGETIYGTLLENIGTFPMRITAGSGADSAKKGIENFISAGDYSLQNFARDTRGFLAMDYLLFSGNSAVTIQKFSGDAGRNRREYLRAVARDITQKLNDAAIGWTAYKTEFLAKNGTDAGSSTALLFNELNKSYELIKNYKVGVPAGKRAGQTKSEPEKVEAFYSGISLECIRRHFAAVQTVWHGKNGIGFEEYLASIQGGKELADETIKQFGEVEKALAVFPVNARFSDEIQTNITAVEALHTELQKCTRFLKSDMSSLLGISITYASNDGD